MSHNIKLKIILIGESTVGKSSLLMKYIDDNFAKEWISTVGIDYKSKTVEINGKLIKLQIWDTAGQERYESITKAYYRNTDGVILIFDVTNRKSFEKIVTWLEKSSQNDSSCIKIVIGNKIDLEDKRKVSREEAENFAKKRKLLYFEVSAKTGENIDHCFDRLCEKILNSQNLNINNESNNIVNLSYDTLNKCSCFSYCC